MENDKQTIMNGHQDNSNIVTILFGAILATMNHVFGWMNTLLDIHISNFIMTLFQAMLTGSVGALSAYFTNKLLKRHDKRKHNGKSH